MKFRKKNSVVDAEQVVDPCQHPHIERTDGGWRMLTPDGWRKVREGDWIVTDSTGTAWSIPNSVFINLYEPHDDQSST